MGFDAGYDCQECGACCIDRQSGAGYVSLSRDESKRMQRLGLHIIVGTACSLLGTRARAGVNGRACVAFSGEVGTDCRCTVYVDRPRVCRTYQAGSSECRKERRAAGLPV